MMITPLVTNKINYTTRASMRVRFGVSPIHEKLDPIYGLQEKRADDFVRINPKLSQRALKQMIYLIESEASAGKQFLDKGLQGETYLLSGIPGFSKGVVAKTPLLGQEDQWHALVREADSLSRQRWEKTGQQWLATIMVNGKPYLLTTYAGEQSELKPGLYKPIMKELLKWDRVKTLHLDLHMRNIVFSRNWLMQKKAHLIDFGLSIQDEPILSNRNLPSILFLFICPYGYPAHNLRFFETHALFGSWYDRLYDTYAQRKTLDEPKYDQTLRQEFVQFLGSASYYYRHYRSPALRPMDSAYETYHSIAHILKRQPKSVVDIEASRIQVLFDLERAYHADVSNHRSLKEYFWWQYEALRHAQRYEDLVNKFEPSSNVDADRRQYHDYHKRLAFYYVTGVRIKLKETLGEELKKQGKPPDYVMTVKQDIGKFRKFDDFWKAMGEPLAPERKPFNSFSDIPSDYDFAGRIIGRRIW